MLQLITRGPNMIAVHTAQQEKFLKYLQAHFACVPIDYLSMGIDVTQIHCVLCVADIEGTEETMLYLGLKEPVSDVLCYLMQADAAAMIQRIRPLPQVIIFNSLGEQKQKKKKIQRELSGEAAGLEELLRREDRDGVALVFLMQDGPGKRKFYEQILFIQQDYASLLRYLSIHAPRYLAKAFAPDVWHMVDLRIFDRYEAYDLQYKRLTKAIEDLKLGYLVTETWDREISAFAEPVGTYRIRLLTFLKPLDLKKFLIALEYGQGGSRIVDLDLIWHNKKISWKDLLDDKDLRKKIKNTVSFFPKSHFFAVQNEKAELIKYCMEELRGMMTEETKDILKIYEQRILADAEGK